MRPIPSASIGNILAWVVVLALAAAAVALVLRIGPLALVLLGLLTLFVCSQFSLDEATPGWGTEVFRARMMTTSSPEQRAAEAAGRDAFLPLLRFGRRCGFVLLLSGAAAIAWQYLL